MFETKARDGGNIRPSKFMCGHIELRAGAVIFGLNFILSFLCEAFEQVIAKTGVAPAQIIDWLSLVGDAVDGIPGVPGVGPKTAAKLLNEYKTAENIYQNLAAISSDKLRAKMVAAEADVWRNQKLVRLKKMPQWTVPLADLIPGEQDFAKLHAQYSRWNFRSLLKELDLDRQGELL